MFILGLCLDHFLKPRVDSNIYSLLQCDTAHWNGASVNLTRYAPVQTKSAENILIAE